MDTPHASSSDPLRHRKTRALLARCALLHWHATLEAWLAHYAGLEEVVDDERDGPVAAVTGLLRLLARVGGRPTDVEFAHTLAELEFLKYRIRRTPPGLHPSFESAETWCPATMSLSAFRVGFVLGGYRADRPALAPERIVGQLLQSLQRGLIRHG